MAAEVSNKPTMEPYDIKSHQWSSYVQKFNDYVNENGITNDKKLPAFLSVVGEPTYNLMKELCAPDTPEDKSFGDLVELVRTRLEIPKSEIQKRYDFHSRRQEDHEMIKEYLEGLKPLAEACNFGERLQDNLLDQFLLGLRSDSIRSKIFEQDKLDFNKAVKLALELEANDWREWRQPNKLKFLDSVNHPNCRQFRKTMSEALCEVPRTERDFAEDSNNMDNYQNLVQSYNFEDVY